MKSPFVFVMALIVVVSFTQCKHGAQERDKVTVDYTMAERAIDWLEFVNSGADDKAVRKHFMKNVAPTGGCKSIIRHWRRFMKWDKEKFSTFIMEGLDRIPTDGPLENEDGSLTGLGRRKLLWKSALADPAKLRDDIENLKKANLVDTSLALAKKFLPDDANVSNNFFIVLFGGSSAYSVGKENGFDLLQLPKQADGTIDVEEVIGTFAHEMHHSGLISCSKTKKNIQLIGVLAAEGMPTYFIDKTRDKIEKYKASHNKVQQDLALQWETHLARLPDIYIEAERDIGLNLKGEIGQEEIWDTWMTGLHGQAYALGADMFSVIDKYLGVDVAKPVVHDARQFLIIYNQAAQKGNKEGGNYYVFDEDLANRVANYTGK